MKKLRIAQFVTSEVQYPLPSDFLKAWAPIQIAADICQFLTKKGHQIIYFGPKGTKSDQFTVREFKNIVPFYNNPLIPILNPRRRETVIGLSDQYIIGEIFKEHQKNPFNAIHFHSLDRALPLFYLFPQNPVVFTLHDPKTAWRSYVNQLFQPPTLRLITISNAQKKADPQIKSYATIYNGINLKLFPFSIKTKDQLLLISRLNEEKGVIEAVKVANLVKHPLLLIGQIDNPEYWQNTIKPLFNKSIRHIGFTPHEKLHRYFGQAKVFLMPIMWEEPFGLVMVEAMACGTPVVAFNRGSVPEVIKDGKTGFIVKPGDIKAMAKAVQRIYDMPKEKYQKMRQNCRKHVEDNFTIEKMADNYEKVYQQIVKKWQKK